MGHKVELKVLYQFRKHRNDRKSKSKLFSFNCSCLMRGVFWTDGADEPISEAETPKSKKKKKAKKCRESRSSKRQKLLREVRVLSLGSEYMLYIDI